MKISFSVMSFSTVQYLFCEVEEYFIFCHVTYNLIDNLENLSSRVAWGILCRGVFWVSGLPTFLKPFFNNVLKVLETSHV